MRRNLKFCIMKPCAILEMTLSFCLMAAIGSIGHIICLTIISRKKLMRTPRFLIVACISVTDLVFCITVSISYTVATQYHEGTACDIVSESGGFIAHITFHMSLMLSMLMSVNQLLAIQHGIIYNTIVTCHRIKMTVAATLIFIILVDISPFAQ